MAAIKEDYVSFETAKLLKEKGFDEGCRARYGTAGSFSYEKYEIESGGCEMHNAILAPTLQMAMKWLRKVHNIFISITYENDGVFTANLKVPLKGVDCMIDNMHNCWLTYEEAAEASIKYCLENLI